MTVHTIDYIAPRTTAEKVELVDTTGPVPRKNPADAYTFEITAYISESLNDSLEEIADARGIAKSKMVRNLLTDFVEAHQRGPRRGHKR